MHDRIAQLESQVRALDEGATTEHSQLWDAIQELRQAVRKIAEDAGAKAPVFRVLAGSPKAR